ncbi:Hemolysin transporter protein shlB precursor [Serratia marcescens]|nr:Hemolysin transporter protein shlB precursor [Serratia marcescens]
MIKKITALTLLVSTALSAETLPDAHMMRDMSMGESRRALQDSTREVNQLIEQRRYQQLKQQRLLAEPEPAAPALPQCAVPADRRRLSAGRHPALAGRFIRPERAAGKLYQQQRYQSPDP